MDIKTKLSLRDKIYAIESTEYIGKKTCSTCDGKGKIPVKNWDDQICPQCYGKGCNEEYGIKEWRINEHFSGLPVGKIYIDVGLKRKNSDKYDTKIKYFPIGMGNWINEEDIFPTNEEALSECKRRNESINNKTDDE